MPIFVFFMICPSKWQSLFFSSASFRSFYLWKNSYFLIYGHTSITLNQTISYFSNGSFNRLFINDYRSTSITVLLEYFPRFNLPLHLRHFLNFPLKEIYFSYLVKKNNCIEFIYFRYNSYFCCSQL